MKSIDLRFKTPRLNVILLVCAMFLGSSIGVAAGSASSEADAPIQTASLTNTKDVAAPINELDQGKHLFGYWCSSCHGPGPGHPGTQALEQKYSGNQPAALEGRTNLPPNLTKYYVRTGISIMPFFRKTEISESELDDIALYLARNIPAPAK